MTVEEHVAPEVRPGQAGTAPAPAAAEADVHLDHVTKAFGETVAVDDVELEIERGEFFSLLGPSGCGKTTTLALIGGFEQPTAGTVYLGGRDVGLVPPHRRDTNTVFQSYALFPHLNVFDNVAFGLRRKRLARDEIREKVARILELVDLPGLERRRPGQLSGGQQQRVALARALVNEPRVLLLDEPLGALDLKLRKQMQLELKRIQHEVGVTFLYVTHDQDEAMVMSNRLAVMSGGRIEQVGSPEDVYDRPATEFVAGFLGASNLLPGTVTGTDGRLATIALASGEVVSVPADRLPAGAGAVKVGVRPEKFRLREDGEAPAGGWNAIAGRVVEASYLGVSHQYVVERPEGASLTVYVQNVGADAPAAPGDTVRLLWRPEHAFVV